MSILSRSPSSWCVPAVLSGAVLIVYSFAFTYPSFNPEHALYYVLNDGLTLERLISEYTNPAQGFYRPTVFFGYYQLVSAAFGWDAIYGFKLVSLLLLLGYGLLVYKLGLIWWEGDRLAAGLAAVLAAIHPIHYVQVYETVGFDLIYQILVMGCLVLYFGPALRGRWRWLLVVYAVLFRPSGPERRPQRLMAVMVAALGVAFMAFYAGRLGYIDTGPYRTGPNWPQILINLKSGILWICHIFTLHNPVWPLALIQDTRSNFAFGVAVVAVTASYLIMVLRGAGAPGEARRLALVGSFLGVVLVIPVYSGGRPWHFGLPLAAFALMEGRALAWLIRRLGSPRARLGVLCGVLAVTLTLSALDFRRELNRRLWLFRINTEALRHPPIAPAAMPRGATVLYRVDPDVWSYGVGHLFRFVYQDPSITELTVAPGAAPDPATWQRWLDAPNAFFFVYDPVALPAWRDCSAVLRRQLLAGAPPGCTAPLAARPGDS